MMRSSISQTRIASRTWLSISTCSRILASRACDSLKSRNISVTKCSPPAVAAFANDPSQGNSEPSLRKAMPLANVSRRSRRIARKSRISWATNSRSRDGTKSSSGRPSADNPSQRCILAAAGFIKRILKSSLNVMMPSPAESKMAPSSAWLNRKSGFGLVAFLAVDVGGDATQHEQGKGNQVAGDDEMLGSGRSRLCRCFPSRRAAFVLPPAFRQQPCAFRPSALFRARP